jgi:hypothetical protein
MEEIHVVVSGNKMAVSNRRQSSDVLKIFA